MNLNDLTVEKITEFADSPAIFHQGQECYDNGSVEQFFMSGKGIKAKVKAKTEQYSVEIRTGQGKLTTDCTCAYPGEVCEHIVAVLLYSLLGDPEEQDDDEYEEPMMMVVPHQGIPVPGNILQQLLRGELYIEDVFELIAQAERLNNVIPFPNAKKMTVAELKQEIQEFFEAVQAGEEEPANPFDGGFFALNQPDLPNLNAVFAQVQHLTPEEQIDVLWYVVTSGNLIFSQTGTVFGEAQIADAVDLFARCVKALELEMPQKEVYLNSLIAAFDWPMFLNEELDFALREAMDILCSTEEEFRYAIATLETIGLERNSREWVMNAYRRLGDDETFLQLYEENLNRVEQYLMLATYWRDMQGNIPKSIAILERWITEQTPKNQDKLADWAYLYYEDCPSTDELLTELTEYYYEQGDRPNLYRLLLLWLRIDGLCLELYDKLKSVAMELKCWEDCQRQMHLFARDDAEVLATIYLKEQNWEAAISLAQTADCPVAVKQAVATQVKSSHPEEAIALYDQLVHHYIQKKNRTNYQSAAKLVKQIRKIYLSILNRPFLWENYLCDLQQQYQRYRALQEELQKL